jgi:hypothetical protein
VVHRLHQEAEQVNALARLQDVGCLHHLDLSAVLDDEAREERVPAQRSRREESEEKEGSEKRVGKRARMGKECENSEESEEKEGSEKSEDGKRV